MQDVNQTDVEEERTEFFLFSKFGKQMRKRLGLKESGNGSLGFWIDSS